MIFFVFNIAKNILEKEENAGNQHFLLYPECFQKTSFPEQKKSEILWEWVNTAPYPS